MGGDAKGEMVGWVGWGGGMRRWDGGMEFEGMGMGAWRELEEMVRCGGEGGL